VGLRLAAWPSVERAPSWRDRAACRTADLDAFCTTAPTVQATALAICRSCPVRSACLADALAEERHTWPFGIPGGPTAPERSSRRRRRKAPA
jgi:WhiB family redox-sensing transcriptional regulator